MSSTSEGSAPLSDVADIEDDWVRDAEEIPRFRWRRSPRTVGNEASTVPGDDSATTSRGDTAESEASSASAGERPLWWSLLRNSPAPPRGRVAESQDLAISIGDVGEHPQPQDAAVEAEDSAISDENTVGEHPDPRPADGPVEAEDLIETFDESVAVGERPHPDPGESAEEVDQVVSSIKRKLLQARHDEQPLRESPPTIHRVRPRVREVDPRAYDPSRVSLGPFHHGKDGLEEMEKLKPRFLGDLLRRSPLNSVEKYADAVRACAPLAKVQYSGDVGVLQHDAFVEMMVLDGCFLLECLVKCGRGHLGSELTSANCNTKVLRSDALLIENQIPFFVVEALLEASTLSWHLLEGRVPPTLTGLANHFLKIENTPARPTSGVHHLLHLFHSSLDPELSPDPPRKSWRHAAIHALRAAINYLVSSIFYGVLYLLLMCGLFRRSSSNSTKGQRSPRMIPCATELREAGICIKKKREEVTKAFSLKVSFGDGTLEIPVLYVGSSTNSTFRNLIAFEQRYPTVGNYFTSYAIFLDNLINTAADVGVLRSCGVMESKLGSDEEVAQMFNTICKGSHLDYENHYLGPVFRDVKSYCESSRHRWRAKLVHDYFSTPWGVISLVVASFLLVFTGLQAAFAVLSYFRPP